MDHAGSREVVLRRAGGGEIHRQPVEQEPAVGREADAFAIESGESATLPQACQVELHRGRVGHRVAEIGAKREPDPLQRRVLGRDPLLPLEGGAAGAEARFQLSSDPKTQ